MHQTPWACSCASAPKKVMAVTISSIFHSPPRPSLMHVCLQVVCKWVTGHESCAVRLLQILYCTIISLSTAKTSILLHINITVGNHKTVILTKGGSKSLCDLSMAWTVAYCGIKHNVDYWLHSIIISSKAWGIVRLNYSAACFVYWCCQL